MLTERGAQLLPQKPNLLDQGQEEMWDLRIGQNLGEIIVFQSGDLQLVDTYYGGNIGLGRAHPKELGLSGIDETIVSRITVGEKLSVKTALVLTVPEDTEVDVTLLNNEGEFSDLSTKEAHFMYVPAGFQFFGTIGKTEFVTYDGEDILYGGRLGWAGRNIRNQMGMSGGRLYRFSEQNSSIELGNTGIVAARWQ